MKKTVVAALAVFALFSESDAMNNIPAAITSATFHCATNPPVDLVRMSDGRLWMGGINAKSLNISCVEYNGIPVLRPLTVDGSMSNAAIIAALTASFGREVSVE
ncbi:MAG: hypothetical protein LBO73_04020 [Holosporaceae bacterium]|nr:hypothetical protein [Holosporaceae bacterium]